MERYAYLLQTAFPSSMLTPYLHLVARHFWQYEKAWGPLSGCSELYMERSVQCSKSAVTGCLSREPEKTILIGELTRAALNLLPNSGRSLFNRLIPKYSEAPLNGTLYDNGNAVGEQLLHKGRQLTGRGWSPDTRLSPAQLHRNALQLVRSYVLESPQSARVQQ